MTPAQNVVMPITSGAQIGASVFPGSRTSRAHDDRPVRGSNWQPPLGAVLDHRSCLGPGRVPPGWLSPGAGQLEGVGHDVAGAGEVLPRCQASSGLRRADLVADIGQVRLAPGALGAIKVATVSPGRGLPTSCPPAERHIAPTGHHVMVFKDVYGLVGRWLVRSGRRGREFKSPPPDWIERAWSQALSPRPGPDGSSIGIAFHPARSVTGTGRPWQPQPPAADR